MHTMWKRRENSNVVRGTRRWRRAAQVVAGYCYDRWSLETRTRQIYHRPRQPRLSVGESMMSCPRAGCECGVRSNVAPVGNTNTLPWVAAIEDHIKLAPQ